MNPEHRLMAWVSVDDAAEADKIFDVDMTAWNHVEFIEENAEYRHTRCIKFTERFPLMDILWYNY